MRRILPILAFTVLTCSSTFARSIVLGGADAGGGNSVGAEIFDDFENSGSTLLSSEKIQSLVEPYLKALTFKVPGFAQELSKGIDGVQWYLEAKPLAQSGDCVNQNVFSIELTVRACQSKYTVRVDQKFFEENPQIQGPLLLHELLVYFKLHHAEAQIDDEGIRIVNRAIRDPRTSSSDLQNIISNTGFGDYASSEIIDFLKNVIENHKGGSYLVYLQRFPGGPCSEEEASQVQKYIEIAKRSMTEEEFIATFGGLPIGNGVIGSITVEPTCNFYIDRPQFKTR